MVVGDVHGDIQRLFQALKPFPQEEWRTIFLGDLVDGGPFGVGALRYARDRLNSTLLLGNHEVALLWALTDKATMSNWMSIGGQPHDLAELAKDPELEAWLRSRPLLLRTDDGTLFQHSDTDYYARLIDRNQTDPIAAINQEAERLLGERNEQPLWDLLAPGMVFRTARPRLDAWLDRTHSYRVIHGHKPHGQRQPDTYQNGLATCYDGGLSRYRGSRFQRRGPLQASVGPLPHW